jgi:hypothetical protein
MILLQATIFLLLLIRQFISKPVTAPIVWPDAPPRSTTSLPTTESLSINQNNIYKRPNSDFNRITSNRILADDDIIDRPQRLTNTYTPITTVLPASDIEDRHGRLRRRRKRPCVPVAKPKPPRYRDAGQRRQLQNGKTLYDVNLYYLNLAPSPYTDPEPAITNDKPIVDDNSPAYDAYGGYECIPSYLYYGQGGGSGGHFQHFQNHQHGSGGHHQSSSSHHQSSSSHHTSNGQINYDDINTESRPPYSGNRPSGGPFGFFGQGGLFDWSTWFPRPVPGGGGGTVYGDEGVPTRPVYEINIQDIITNFSDNWRPAVVGGVSGAVMGFVQQLSSEVSRYIPF